jgi:hypothetical protein
VTEIAAPAQRPVLGPAAWPTGARGRAIELAVRFAAWAGAEWQLLRTPPPGGAYHGSPPPSDGYLALIRGAWGRP